MQKTNETRNINWFDYDYDYNYKAIEYMFIILIENMYNVYIYIFLWEIYKYMKNNRTWTFTIFHKYPMMIA